jgi:hypothetical protein
MYDFGMRFMFCMLPLLLLVPAACAQNSASTRPKDDTQYQTGYCPQTHALQAAPQAEYWFEGSIGKAAVRMYLDRGGDGVVGLFYAISGEWTPTLLGGEWSAAGVSLDGESDDHARQGRLHGRIEKNVFIGNWTPATGNRLEPVHLTTMPQPACDGKGPWNHFVDPRWPLSFSYPAGWQVQRKGEYLQLVCPDPETMAYNSAVTIEMGTGEPPGSGALQHCPDGWKYGSLCDCSNEHSDECRIPKITRTSGKTFLDLDETEWRVYCRNEGYVGQGYGEHRIVLLQHAWMDIYATGPASPIVDRLTESTSPYGAAKAEQAPSTGRKLNRQ